MKNRIELLIYILLFLLCCCQLKHTTKSKKNQPSFPNLHVADPIREGIVKNNIKEVIIEGDTSTNNSFDIGSITVKRYDKDGFNTYTKTCISKFDKNTCEEYTYKYNEIGLLLEEKQIFPMYQTYFRCSYQYIPAESKFICYVIRASEKKDSLYTEAKGDYIFNNEGYLSEIITYDSETFSKKTDFKEYYIYNDQNQIIQYTRGYCRTIYHYNSNHLIESIEYYQVGRLLWKKYFNNQGLVISEGWFHLSSGEFHKRYLYTYKTF
jgi:hypothetical protein